MIRGLGCDLCAISRMEKIMADGRFLHRYFTEGERAYIAARARGAQTAAGVKALGTGFGSLAPADVEITHDASGAPAYLINKKTRSALQARGAQSAFLSVTHDGDYAMATAILEG